MPTPLRFDQILPNGEPLRLDMPGVRFDSGTVEEVMALNYPDYPLNPPMPASYHITQTITDETLAAYLAKLDEADALIPWIRDMVPGAAGKLNTIGVERAGLVPALLMEIAAHPEFMPPDVDPDHAPAKAALLDKLKRMLDRREDSNKRLLEAAYRASDDLMFDGSAYYTNAQLNAKRQVPNAATTVANLKPYLGKGGKKKTTTPTPPAP